MKNSDNSVQNYYSTLTGWMIPTSKAMDAHSIDIAAALKECDISQDVMADQESRIAAEKLTQLIHYCNAQLVRHDFSILIAEQFHPGMFHALGYAMMSSNTLQDALQRIAHYKRVVSNTCKLVNYEEDDQFVFEMQIITYETTNRPVLSLVTVETFLATIIRFSRELVTLDFSPIKVCFAYAKPDHDISYLEDFFNCEIEFSSDKTAIYFDLEQTQEKLMCGNPLITQSHEKMLDEFMARVDKNDLTHVIKNKIFELLPLGAPSQTDIADYLGMSLRNLQRKLHDQGTSYKEILENTRKKLAMDYIVQQHLSLSEIGYLVGFSSVGNFNRAFKRWTNQTPGDYRQGKKS
ncbi:AraC family transcriptional regulator [Colwellia psychrerythraea]|uniref:Transcriptional regulator, AraC family n=1 Tax=Colwellia psychrerythraea TaxID=28229 RepID=A0A099KKL0_COLPS|nr:AraC family transcriptional regulator [Colwellia psychrerythraea]KGJ90805.1 transcriptional regulator, AraC family [Colwellia psychrerythraea]